MNTTSATPDITEPFAAEPIRVSAFDLVCFDLSRDHGDDHDPGLDDCDDECEHFVSLADACAACDAELVVRFAETAEEHREGLAVDAWLDDPHDFY